MLVDRVVRDPRVYVWLNVSGHVRVGAWDPAGVSSWRAPRGLLQCVCFNMRFFIIIITQTRA